jgi:predicted Holliday junction resolvase-like endonuclease
MEQKMQLKYGLLFVVLFFSFFLSDLSLLVIEKTWNYYELQAALEAAEKKLAYEKAKLEAQLQAQEIVQNQKIEEARQKAAIIKKQQEELAKKAAIENERRTNAQRINSETCRFWRDAYNSEKTQKAKVMMESACRRALSD